MIERLIFFYWSGLSSVQFRLITNTKIPLAGLRTFLRSLKEISWYFAKINQLIQLTLENYVKPKDNFCYLRLTWKQNAVSEMKATFFPTRSCSVIAEKTLFKLPSEGARTLYLSWYYTVGVESSTWFWHLSAWTVKPVFKRLTLHKPWDKVRQFYPVSLKLTFFSSIYHYVRV